MLPKRHGIPPRRKPAGKGDIGGRERVLGAAVRLFAAKGFAATTVRDILRESGVTAPVLYYHFGSKEGVFLALAEEATRKLEAAHARALGRKGTAAERIRAYCRASFAVRREYADLAWIVDAMLSGPPEAAPCFDVQAIVAASVRQLEALVREGIDRGEFRACDPLHVALTLIGAVVQASRPRLFEAVIADVGDTLEGMMSVILAGLVAPSA